MPPAVGTALPAIQRIPSRVRPWEKTVAGPEILQAARVAEDAGFGWLSCSDHPMVPASRAEAMGPTWYDAGSTLAFVAGVTTRIRLLSHVLVVPYRHPLIVAKQYGTLDHLTGGRVILGIGSGHLKPEFRSLGADYERRGKVTDEYLGAISAAWGSDVASFQGETVSFRDAMVFPRPAQKPRPPFWVGGNSAAALRRAAKLCEGWIPWALPVDEFAQLVAQAKRVRAEAGRTDPIEMVAPLEIPPAMTADAALTMLRTWVAAGATSFHVGVPADSFAQYVDRLGWIGQHVIARLD